MYEACAEFTATIVEEARHKYVSVQQRICFQTFRLVLKRAVLDKKMETRFSVCKVCLSAMSKAHGASKTAARISRRRNVRERWARGFVADQSLLWDYDEHGTGLHSHSEVNRSMGEEFVAN